MMPVLKRIHSPPGFTVVPVHYSADPERHGGGEKDHMSVELKPCPFCGKEAELRDLGKGYGGWMVSCLNVDCGTLMTAFAKKAHDKEGIYQEIRALVIKQWNTRI